MNVIFAKDHLEKLPYSRVARPSPTSVTQKKKRPAAMHFSDVLIIGAGLAGLFSAIHTCLKGVTVCILEKNNSAGKKLLISGSGQCNITHAGHIEDFFCHYGDHDTFIRPALFNYSNKNLIHFFETRKLKLKEMNNGNIFPESLRSGDVLDVLLGECKAKGVDIRYNASVKSISQGIMVLRFKQKK